ncbi:MAG: S8 family peptidase [Acidobacteriota bacterium]|jgi:serine protease|nr:S8 family peptidase [Acidobacteriota bacterium]
MKSMQGTKSIFLAAGMAALLAVGCGGGSGDVSGNGAGGGGATNAASRYEVGGSVTGLAKAQTLVLQNNGGEKLSVSANGSFAFPTALANGSAYQVTVATMPTGQNCYVLGGSGVIEAADTASVKIVCGAKGISLSGKIAVSQGVLIDSDVNDINENYVSNDTIDSAQPLPNPVAVGGYVNLPGKGTSGRSYVIGDADDYFRVRLKSGDPVVLVTGESDTSGNDLDLCLYDSGKVKLDCSMGTGSYEILHAPAEGDYFVQVGVVSGASNYILVIGDEVSVGTDGEVAILSSQRESVPGQVVVSLKDPGQGGAVAAAAAQGALAKISAMGLRTLSGDAGREMLLTVEDAVALEASIAAADGSDAAPAGNKGLHGQGGDAKSAPGKERVWQTFRAIKSLRKRADVASAEPNYVLRSYGAVPDDPYYDRQWQHAMIKLPEAWEHTTGSDNVIVAVVDTGILKEHPDLRNRLSGTGYDFVKDADLSNDGDGIDPDATDPGDGTNRSFHGTHCAGIIAAETGNGQGVAGTTWHTRIMPVRVLGKDGVGYSYDIRQGIRYAAGMDNDSGTVPARTADIVSMSYGGSVYDSLDQKLFDQVRAKGVILVAAAGNGGTAQASYPAAYDGVISVSAVNADGSKASYSNYGSTVDLAAPGGNSGDLNKDGKSDGVWGPTGDDTSGPVTYTYKAMAGTSMATPHVAGVLALMKAIYPKLTPADVDNMVRLGGLSDDIGAPGRDDYFGYGLVNALKAVTAARTLASGAAVTGMDANPRTVNFGAYGTGVSVRVSKIGTGVLSVAKVSENANWLSVIPVSVDGGGFGDYRFDIDRTALPKEGIYTATAVFVASTGDSMPINVTAQVSAASASYDAGHHFVALVRVGDGSSEGEVVDMVEVTASDGHYAYAFADVVPGTYRILAGSDRDNDGYLADEGESLGAYPSLDEVVEFEVTGTLDNLDFPTGLNLAIGGMLTRSVRTTDGGVLRLNWR